MRRLFLNTDPLMPTYFPAFFVVAFLIGSIPTGYLVARSRGIDIRAIGSGNIGATNLGRVLGMRWFVACSIIDALKGLLPTLAYGLYANLLHLSVPESHAALYSIAIMLAPMLGHVFCPWLKFKGGKGVATGLGSMLGVFPVMTIAGILALLVWLLVFTRTRIISMASVAAGFAIAPLTLAGVVLLARLNRQDPVAMMGIAWPYSLLGVGLALFAMFTHWANIKRLRAGTEPKYEPKYQTKAQLKRAGRMPISGPQM